MEKILADFNNLELMFAVFASLGTCFFFAMLVIQMTGSGDLEGGDGTELVADSSGTADLSFKLLSFHGITAFFMMFGLVGLALSREFFAPAIASVLGAFAAGYFSVVVIGKLFDMFKSLSSSGTLKMDSAIGQEGTVYLNIPENGVGKIQVNIQGKLMTVDAVSENKVVISTGERIMVSGMVDNRVLKVEKL